MPAGRPARKLKSKSPTANLLQKMIVEHPTLSQSDVHKLMGYAETGNALSMYATGRARLPFNRIKEICAILGCDPKELFMTALEEYQPEVLDVFQSVSGVALDPEENEFLTIYREAKFNVRDANVKKGIEEYTQQRVAEGKIPMEREVRNIKRQGVELTKDKAKLRKIKKQLEAIFEPTH